MLFTRTRGLTMDTSTRRTFLFHDLKIPIEDITPEEWFNIIKIFLGACEPFKYLSGYKEIQSFFHYNKPGDYRVRNTPDSLPVFPETVNSRTRCWRLAEIGITIKGNVGEHHDHESTTEDCLLITAEGLLVRWVARYKVRVVRKPGKMSYTYEDAESSLFSVMQDSDLLKLLREGPGTRSFGEMICLSLKKILVETAESAKGRLTRFQGGVRQMENLFSRIDTRRFK
jgi:hypothetical protein